MTGGILTGPLLIGRLLAQIFLLHAENSELRSRIALLAHDDHTTTPPDGEPW